MCSRIFYGQDRRGSNPRPSVLETDALPAELLSSVEETGKRYQPPRECGLARFFVTGVTPVVRAVLLHLESLSVVDLRLHRDVVATLALGALEGDFHPLVVPGHVANSFSRGSQRDPCSAIPCW